MLQIPSIRDQIEISTSQGNKFLSQALENGSLIAFARAIQEFSSSYKFALLLNSKDGTEQFCAFNLGAAHIAGGDATRGIALLQTVLDRGTWPEDRGKESLKAYKGDIHFHLASGYEKLSEIGNAVKHYTSAVLQYDEEKDSRKICETYLKIANIHNAKKEYAEARRNFELAANLYWKSEDWGNALIARTCQANAGAMDKTYNQNECIRLLNSCCDDCAYVRSRNLEGKILCEVGLLFSKLGCLEHALKCFETSIQLSDKTSNLRRRAVALQNAGAILNKLGYHEESLSRHALAAQLHGALMNRNAQGQSFCNLAFAQSQLRHYEDAWESYMHALKAFEDTDDKQGQWQCHEGLGAIAFSNKRLEKAVKHFNMALSCLTIGRDDMSRDRVIFKLNRALKMDGQEMQSNGTVPLAIENGPSMKKSAHAPAGNVLMSDTSPTVPGSIRRNSSNRAPSQKKRKRLERGRRAYSDENDRPVHHIARGISNLTMYSNPYAESQTYISSSDLSDSDKFSSAESSPSNSERKKKHLRKLVQASTMPVISLTVDSDSRDERSGNPSTCARKDTPEKSPRPDSTLESVRKHLTKIDECDSDLTDVTSKSSSSSESSDEQKSVSRPKTTGDGHDTLRRAVPYVNDNPELAPTLTPAAQTLDSTHLYASINATKTRTVKEESKPADVTYDIVPDESKPDDQKSEDNIPSLLTAHSPRNKSAEEDGDSPGISEQASPASQGSDVPPELPLNHPSSKTQQKGKSKASRACVVM